MSDRFTDDIGAYLLGAMDAPEQDAFEAHLEDCEGCRRDVRRLSVARDALPRSVDQLAPPPSIKASLMETVRAEAARSAESAKPRRRPRWVERAFARPAYAAAAAAVMLAIGISLGVLVGAPGGGGGDDGRTLSAVVDQTRMPAGRASLVVPDDGHSGGHLHVEGMQQPQSGKVYEVWVKRGDRVTPSSLFTVGSDGKGTAAIPDDLRDADAVMVTREPNGGSKKPSEPPVVMVSVKS